MTRIELTDEQLAERFPKKAGRPAAIAAQPVAVVLNAQAAAQEVAAAGNAAKLAYGVMSAGANAVMGVIYLIGEAFAVVASNIQSGVAIIMDGLAKITFGDMSASFRDAAAEIRLSAEATWAASEALGKKSTEAFIDMADGAQTARDGFAGLATSATDAKPAIDQASKAMADMATELQKTAEANAAARKATEEKAAADQAAKQSADDNRAAVAQLREEYAALVASGSLQGAAEKLQEIDQALRGTTSASQDAAKAAADAAAQIDAAFSRLGVTSSAALKEQADNAQRDYDTIKNAGTSTAQDIGAAFKVAAEKAIAANEGVAPSWVQAQAGARGYVLEVDAAGKTTVNTMAAAERAVGSVATAHGGAVGAVGRHTSAVRDLGASYSDAGAKALAAQGQFLAAAAAQKSADTSASSITKKPPSESQYAWTRATIIDYLKQSGLDDALSEDLAKQFVQADGSVPYTAGGAQKRWGGQHSTLSEALGKMVDYYKYDDSGKHEAQERSKFLSGKSDANTKPADSAPERSTPTAIPSSSGSGIATGPTYISNINIPGVGSASLKFSDANSQRQNEDLLRRLAQAKGASI